jgi:SAM-dependent methyltransferase
MTLQDRHTGLAPSAWVRRFASLIPAGGTVLDLACGSGRHIPLLRAHGLRVTGVDRDAAALVEARARSGADPLVELRQADLENAPWPFAGRRFAGIVVTHYLWRPLWPDLLSALDEGGVWLHETFALGQERFGRPSRPEFLLQPGELLRVAEGLRVVAFEDGYEPATPERPARCVQRIAALRPRPGEAGMPALDAGGTPVQDG